ncbi:LysR family transcriptional regulator, partial [Zavarzinia sp.]|uniref:LysR family transcriptional regulator n=1 Tax=Zavarzinia sp. TaxID=2027920 RepID=UPI003BB6DC15
MTRRLPSLKALQAAEAVHRLGGVAAAARALAVSQPAVSQQLKLLEADLGQPLFTREKGRLVPTGTGLLMLSRLTQAFALLREAVDLAERETAKGLTVAVLPSFAMRWLIPRLGGFEALHPGIDLRLSTAASPVERLRDGGADLAIDLGRDETAWPGLEAQALLFEDMIPVAAPALARGLRAPADLRSVARLVVDVPERAGDWG